MAILDEVVIRLRAIGGAAAGADIKRAEGAVGGLGRTAKAAAGIAGIAGLTIGLKDSAQAAVAFQAKQAQLANALKNVGQFSRENVAQVTSAAEAMATHGGVGTEDNIQGIQQFIRANVGVTEAIKDQQLANDISIAKGKSLTTVTRALLMVEQGRTTGLGRMGIIIKPVTVAQDRLTASHVKATVEQKRLAKQQDENATKTLALTTLWQRFGGAMEANSKTAAGAASNLKHQFEILKIHLGTALLPIITKFLIALNKVVQFFEHNKTAAQALGIALGALAAAWVATNLAFVATPLGAVIAGLVAAAAAVYLLVKNWKEVRKWMDDHQWIYAIMAVVAVLNPALEVVAVIVLIVTHFKDMKKWAIEAFANVKRAAADVFRFLKPGLLAIKTVAVTVFNVIKSVAMAAFSVIKVIAGVVFAFLRVGFAIVRKVAETVAYAISAVWRSVVAPVFNAVVKPALNAVKDVALFLWHHVFAPFGSFLGGAFKTAWTVLKGIWSAAETVARAIASAFREVLSVFKDIGNWVATAGKDVQHFIDNLNPFSGGSPQGFRAAVGNPLGGRAYGGTQRRAGWVDVGEHGKERVFLPGGAVVQPYEGAAQAADGSTPASHPLEATFYIGSRQFMKAQGYAQAKLKATS